MANSWKVVSAKEARAHPLYGVGGWLLFLVVSMIVLGPILGIVRIAADFANAERQYLAIAHSAGWTTFKSITWWIFSLLAALSVYGGWGLAKGNGWSVVKRAQSILWISGPIGSLVMGVLVPLVVFGSFKEVGVEFVGGFLASVVGAAVWTTYLSKSKRVRVTFTHSVLVNSANSNDGTEVRKMGSQLQQHSYLPLVGKPEATMQDATIPAHHSEDFWANALEEYESSARRPGLYARFFSQSQGNEAVAKASYLKHRVEELTHEHKQLLLAQEKSELEATQKFNLAKFDEAQRALDLLPKGHCPRCDALVAMSAQECPECPALFGVGSAWQILPNKKD